jgi:hypothetical protein
MAVTLKLKLGALVGPQVPSGPAITGTPACHHRSSRPGVTKAWLYTRKIYAEVARDGYFMPRCPEGWLDDDAILELAGETAAKALRYSSSTC